MSMTAVPISMRLVLAPLAASSGNGEASWRAKWCTRKYAPSAPTSSAATARSIDCSSASDALRVPECGDGDQWPKERKPIFFIALTLGIELSYSQDRDRRARVLGRRPRNHPFNAHEHWPAPPLRWWRA